MKYITSIIAVSSVTGELKKWIVPVIELKQEMEHIEACLIRNGASKEIINEIKKVSKIMTVSSGRDYLETLRIVSNLVINRLILGESVTIDYVSGMDKIVNNKKSTI